MAGGWRGGGEGWESLSRREEETVGGGTSGSLEAGTLGTREAREESV